MLVSVSRCGPLIASVLADPQTAWDGWTMPQRRAAITALCESITVMHLAKAQGPTVNISPIEVKWKEVP